MTHAVILVAHGTRDPQGQQTVLDIVDAVQAARPDLVVSDAYVDVQEPRIQAAVERLAPQHDSVAIVPLLFCEGYHMSVDIGAAVKAHPNVRSTGPMSPCERIAVILTERLDEAGVPRAEPSAPVVLAAAGSTWPGANDAIRDQAKLLAGLWGGPVSVGYGSAGTPSVRDAVMSNRDWPGAKVAIAALLLGEGHFARLVRGSGADVVTVPIGPHPLLIEEVLERISTL